MIGINIKDFDICVHSINIGDLIVWEYNKIELSEIMYVVGIGSFYRGTDMCCKRIKNGMITVNEYYYSDILLKTNFCRLIKRKNNDK